MTSSRRKSFGWLVVLVLSLACVPGAATPISTLDPVMIGTYVAQTEISALTQTAAAAPMLRPSSTFALTFTPEPTFTAVPQIVFPSPTGAPRIQYFRIKHDSQLAYYNYKSRTIDPDWNVEKYGLQTPEIAELTLGLDLKSGTNRTEMTGRWEVFLEALNFNDPKKLLYVKSNETALFDMPGGYPKMESVTMGGNIITLDEIRSGWGRVHTMSYTYPEPFDDLNYMTRPDLIHKFVIVGWRKTTRTTYLTNPPPPYGDLYYPLVSSKPVWIPMEFLEHFPFLPLEVEAKIDQPIRRSPARDGTLTTLEFTEGETATLVDYLPSGSDVWGKLSNGGWIVLFMYEKTGPTYFTSWVMETVPPLPPVDWPE